MTEDAAELVALARAIERARQERERFFPPGLFGEPGWSLLLDLFVAHHEGRLLNTSGTCFGAHIPQTTGLRWLEKLDAAGLIERLPHPHDTRFVMVRLSPDGVARMTAALDDIRQRVGGRRARPRLVSNTPI